MVLELFIWGTHSPPFVNFTFTEDQQEEELTYSLDALATIIMLFRPYHLIRVFTVHSYWSSEDTEQILSDCKILGGRDFTIKWEFKERPYTILLVSILVSILIFGFALRIAEIPYMAVSNQDWTYLWNAIWSIIITMTTVGYGDFFPMTYLGRGIGVWGWFLGTFLISLMIVSLSISSDFTINQKKAYRDAVKYNVNLKNKKYAVILIQTWVRYRQFMRKNKNVSDRMKEKKILMIKNAIKNFKEQRLKIRSMELGIGEDEYIPDENKESYDIDKLVTDTKIVARTEDLIKKIERNQDEIENLIQEILEIGSSLLLKVDDFRDESFIENFKLLFTGNIDSDSHPFKSLSTKTPSIRVSQV
jgi:hypothetical protein